MCLRSAQSHCASIVADSSESTGLKWVAPAGGGKVLQVVQGTTTTRMQTTSTSYVDTNLTASITPSSATSKVLVLAFQNIHMSRSGSGGIGVQYKLVQTATTLSEYYLSFFKGASGDEEIRMMGTFNYLDSPATTSSTTYKTQIRSDAASTNTDCQENSSLAAIVLLEIGA